MQNISVANERRSSERFPIERTVRYKLMESRTLVREGAGTTVDISSSGISFRAGERLPRGSRVEVAVSWPVLLNETCPLKLVAAGRIVRVDADRAAMSIDKYEFRTMARAGSA